MRDAETTTTTTHHTAMDQPVDGQVSARLSVGGWRWLRNNNKTNSSAHKTKQNFANQERDRASDLEGLIGGQSSCCCCCYRTGQHHITQQSSNVTMNFPSCCCCCCCCCQSVCIHCVSRRRCDLLPTVREPPSTGSGLLTRHMKQGTPSPEATPPQQGTQRFDSRHEELSLVDPTTTTITTAGARKFHRSRSRLLLAWLVSAWIHLQLRQDLAGLSPQWLVSAETMRSPKLTNAQFGDPTLIRFKDTKDIMGRNPMHPNKHNSRPTSNRQEASDAARPQRFRKEPPKRKELVEGDTATLPCEIENQHGDAMWIRDNAGIVFKENRTKVLQDPRFRVEGSSSLGVHNLVIDNANINDTDIYRCQVSDELLAEVVVKVGERQPPEPPASRASLESSSASLLTGDDRQVQARDVMGGLNKAGFTKLVSGQQQQQQQQQSLSSPFGGSNSGASNYHAPSDFISPHSTQFNRALAAPVSMSNSLVAGQPVVGVGSRGLSPGSSPAGAVQPSTVSSQHLIVLLPWLGVAIACLLFFINIYLVVSLIKRHLRVRKQQAFQHRRHHESSIESGSSVCTRVDFE